MALADTVQVALILLEESTLVQHRAPAAGVHTLETLAPVNVIAKAMTDAAKLESLQGPCMRSANASATAIRPTTTDGTSPPPTVMNP